MSARVTKRKLTLAEAADQFKRAKKLAAEAKALRDEADPVLISYFERTGKGAYKGIGYSVSTQTRLATTKVREFLGVKVRDFEETVTRRALSLLGGGE